MLRMLIGVLCVIVMYVTGSNGEWGAFWLATIFLAAMVVFSLLLLGEGRKTARAWVNCRDYWANGGPKR